MPENTLKRCVRCLANFFTSYEAQTYCQACMSELEMEEDYTPDPMEEIRHD